MLQEVGDARVEGWARGLDGGNVDGDTSGSGLVV